MSLPVITALILPVWIFISAWTLCIMAFLLYVIWRSRAARKVI